MKFTYAYKSKDGVRHTDVISAASKDAAYSTLKAQGIKPIRVDLAPGFFNRILSLGKRGLAIAILAVVSIAAVLVAINLGDEVRSVRDEATAPMPRHQIFGDPVLMDELERTDFASVFAAPGERFLARFAQPGRAVNGVGMPVTPALADDLRNCLDSSLAISPDEEREIRELKQIVLWMKDELRRYLADGIGTPEKFVVRLEARQRREQQIYAVAQNDLRKTKDRAQWERINKSLKSVGLPAIPRPDDPENQLR